MKIPLSIAKGHFSRELQNVSGWILLYIYGRREAEREASKAVTAVAIEVVVVACCPTSEQAREDATVRDRGG